MRRSYSLQVHYGRLQGTLRYLSTHSAGYQTSVHSTILLQAHYVEKIRAMILLTVSKPLEFCYHI